MGTCLGGVVAAGSCSSFIRCAAHGVVRQLRAVGDLQCSCVKPAMRLGKRQSSCALHHWSYVAACPSVSLLQKREDPLQPRQQPAAHTALAAAYQSMHEGHIGLQTSGSGSMPRGASGKPRCKTSHCQHTSRAVRPCAAHPSGRLPSVVRCAWCGQRATASEKQLSGAETAHARMTACAHWSWASWLTGPHRRQLGSRSATCMHVVQMQPLVTWQGLHGCRACEES